MLIFLAELLSQLLKMAARAGRPGRQMGGRYEEADDGASGARNGTKNYTEFWLKILLRI
jgi:hypothetical protein